MNALIIEATNQTPKVCLDPNNILFEISGKSLPEDADEFYVPIITWLETYCERLHKQTHLNFKLDYFNTASARYIDSIIKTLDTLSDNDEVKISWYYRQIDEDMQLIGEGYVETTQMNFELVEI